MAVRSRVIVISVTLGFWVTQVQEARQSREHAARVLKGGQAEVEHNRAILEPYVAMHEKWTEALAKADTSNSSQSGLDVFFVTRPALPTRATFPCPPPQRMGRGSVGGRAATHRIRSRRGSLRHLPGAEIATGNVDRLANGVLPSATPFDPANRVASVRLLWLTLADIASAEAILLDLYRQHLPTIRAAANGDR